VTPQELVDFETRPYPGHSQSEIFGVAVSALRTIGYEVTLADKSSFHIQTAPRVVMAHAAATSSNTPIATNETTAWDITVLSAAGGATLHAEPRLNRSGASVEPSTFSYDFATEMFMTLYKEMERELSTAASGGAPAATPSKK
jgi:hypothetical protein